MRFELTTLTLARLCSTPELRPHSVGRGLAKAGAGCKGPCRCFSSHLSNRAHLFALGGCFGFGQRAAALRQEFGRLEQSSKVIRQISAL